MKQEFQRATDSWRIQVYTDLLLQQMLSTLDSLFLV